VNDYLERRLLELNFLANILSTVVENDPQRTSAEERRLPQMTAYDAGIGETLSWIASRR
jgi:hypothetical protein